MCLANVGTVHETLNIYPSLTGCPHLVRIPFMEPLIYCTIGRMVALCPRSTLTYLYDKPRVSLRDALPCIPLSQ